MKNRRAEKTRLALVERVKELNCLYTLGELERSDLPTNEILHRAVEIIPSGWQYSEVACARITVDDQESKSKGFKVTPWGQSSDIFVGGGRVGAVEVYYLEEMPARNEGAFLKEERRLIEEIAGYIGGLIDRKRALETLRESEDKYRKLFENLNDAAFLGDAETGVIVDANRQAEILLGRTRDEIVGMHQSQLHPTEKSEEYKSRFRDHVARGRAADYDGEVIRKDGTIVPVYIGAATVTIAGRKMIIGLFRDITERKRADHLLASFAESVVESVPAVVVTLDEQMRIQRFNKFAQELTGYTEEEVRAKDWVDTFTVAEGRQYMRDVIAKTLEGWRPTGHEDFIAAKNGRKILIRWYASPLQDDQGNVIGIVAIGADITEIRHKEELLRRAAKMEAIGRLAGGVAHDFNNYLTAIRGYTNLLLQDLPADDMSRDSLGQISKAANRAAQLTKELLTLGRKAIARPRVMDLNRMLRDIADPLRRMLGEDIELSVRATADLANIKADPGQVEQVIMNLAINARDAMPEGGRLAIDTSNVEHDSSAIEKSPGALPGAHVMLSVTDTGMGMDEYTLQRIFEPFFTTKPDGTGTGLGLATVHGIVRQSAGHIAVESRPGHGTTFSICFPLVEAAEEVEEQPPPPGPVHPGTETILIVEDEQAVRRYVVLVLEKVGYNILEAAGPAEAVSLVANYDKDIHLLVSDVIMPQMSGPELAKKLRALRPEMPVLYVSGYTKDALALRNTLEPGTSLLTKPFGPEELSQEVRRALERKDEE